MSSSARGAQDNGGAGRDLHLDVSDLTLVASNTTLHSPPPSTSSSCATFSTNSGTPSETPENREIKAEITSEEQENLALEFIENKELSSVVSLDRLDDKERIRAQSLMKQGLSWNPTQKKQGHGETTFREQWDLLCNVQEEWKDFAHVFFDEKALDTFLAIRCQRTGIGFMHAVAVFQHYVWYLRTRAVGENHKVLDLSEFVKVQFPKERLENFLLTGFGGSASEFFCEVTGSNHDNMRAESITLPMKSKNERRFRSKLDEICLEFSSTKEPALVSEFKIENDFTTPGKFVYDGEVDPQAPYDFGREYGKLEGNRVLHSMVLIGLKKDDESGKVWFLLQNFWANKYLVVVSGEYLASCYAKVTFAPKNDNFALNDQLPVIDAHYMETEAGPEEETYCEEEDWTPPPDWECITSNKQMMEHYL